ncbi:MAG: glycosyltransferase family 1 protein [bacterium]|nr:glycosyltransferase family 1 protein [bacterium]
MIIGFVTAYSLNNPAGLERATLDLLQALLLNDTVNTYFIYVKKGNGFGDALSKYKNVQIIEIGFGKLWKEFGLRFAPRADVYIFNGFQVPFTFFPRRYAVIVYDFGYRTFFAPGLRSHVKRRLLDTLANLAFRRAQHIFAISEYTKNEIVRLFAVAPKKINIMYLGYTDMSVLPQQTVAGLTQPFFLFVGTLKQRKNPLSALKAFAHFHKTHPEYSLVLAGKPSRESVYHQEMLAIIDRQRLHEKVVFVGRVSDQQLAWLYSNARALVFPSFLEGFGFPILEAASCGTPVITSNIGSLKEIAGEAALLVEPGDSGAIARAMQLVATDEKLRAKLIHKGKIRAGEFSWNTTAAQFLDVINLI